MVTGMAEYIEKEAAKRELYSAFAFHSYAGGMAASVLDKIPAADVRENVVGEWIQAEEKPYMRKHFHTMVCSNCRKRKDGKWNFCPHCGAEMTGGNDG